MKFACSKCDTKYRLSDEKLKDKAVRIRCRNCGNLISASYPPPAPKQTAQIKGGDVKTKKEKKSSFPSHLSLTPTIQNKQWHISINNIPLGPIRTKELVSKMVAGAVQEDSLVWTEGFEQWIALKKIPELLGLLQKTQNINDDGLSEIIPSQEPLTNDLNQDQSLEDPEATQLIKRPSYFNTDLQKNETQKEEPKQDEAQAPKNKAHVVLPQIQAWLSRIQQTHQKLLKKKPVLYWIALTGSIIFGVTFAMMWIIPSDPSSTEVAATATKTTAVKEPEPIVEKSGSSIPSTAISLDEKPTTEELTSEKTDILEESSSPEIKKDEPQTEKTTTQSKKSKTSKKSKRKTRKSEKKKDKEKTKTPKSEKKTKEKDLFKRLSGSSSPNLSSLSAKRNNSNSSASNGEGLDAKQLTQVISRNRPQLRRCYELAARGMSKIPDVRIDVKLTVNSSGQVTRVTTRGKGVGSLTSCIKLAVKRWRFPRSGNVTNTSFPVVFQGS